MHIEEHASLANYSTMRLGGEARYLTKVSSKDELLEATQWAHEHDQKVRVIGGGSNIVFTEAGFNGLIIVNEISGFEVIEERYNYNVIRIGSGENWDETVERIVNMKLSGIEALSLIPGTVGGAPVQNIGAYGQQLADTFVELEALNLNSLEFETLDKGACQFGYRTSRFKAVQNQEYLIASITLKLPKTQMQPPLYQSLQNYLDNHNVTDRSPLSIRDAVIAIRSSKLPDPAQVANCGSFFKNPVVSEEKYQQLQTKYPDLPADRTDDGQLKVRAGWLLENLGLGGYHHPNGMGTWPKSSLVVVNYSAHTSRDLEEFKAFVQAKVKEKFDIELEQEPETIQAA